MKSKNIKMHIKDKQYSIVVGENVMSQILKYIPKDTTRIIIISDKKLSQARSNLKSILKKQAKPVTEISLRAGEGIKNIKHAMIIFNKLLFAKADRKSLIIALGGGTIGDLAGFVASTYMRGIQWIGLPTTLLAQADSSLGGKTGLNLNDGKNLVGTFHHPIAVLCDVLLLKTLKNREIISGLGEILKYALIFDKKFFSWFGNNVSFLLQKSSKHMTEAVYQSLKWKSWCVTEDFYDQTGIREKLNFGHTFAHALESITQYKKFQHGEAVLWGMKFALILSELRKKINKNKKEIMWEVLNTLSIPPLPKNISKKNVFHKMKNDKKRENDKIRYVLLDNIGHAYSDKNVSFKELNRAFKLLTEDKEQ